MKPIIVGIAASAGGLEALTGVLKGLANADNMAIIIAQHLAPDQKSHLAELLNRESHIHVATAEDDQRVEAGQILVIPSGNIATVAEGHIHLEATHSHGTPVPSANELFASLAREYGNRAFGVVLSGTGSDGARGCREIKSQDGFVLVQEPGSARYGGMLEAAIETGAVDLILDVEQMGAELERLARQVDGPHRSEDPKLPKDSTDYVLKLLDNQYGVNFAEYKSSTVNRRILRRTMATNTASVEGYTRYLADHHEELKLLYQDLLISVTGFFRDRDAYDHLKPHIEKLVESKKPGDFIRLWVAGCATGEEAYSLAIFLDQLLGVERTRYKVQVFATDIDEHALDIARKGFYEKGNVRDVSEKMRERYFYSLNGGYVLNKSIREMMVFARHNLSADPPFLHMDLIACRNVMIYFGTRLQQRVQGTFHYALNPQGLLFLGKSESLPNSKIFDVVDNSARLFQRKAVSSKKVMQEFGRVDFYSRRPPLKESRQPVTKVSLEERVKTSINDYLIKTGFVIDDLLDIRFVYGDINRISQMQAGKPGVNVQNLIAPEFQFELKNLVFKARKNRGLHRSSPVHTDTGSVIFEVAPIPTEPDEDILYFVRYEHFERMEIQAGEEAPDTAQVAQLQYELMVNREHVQTLIEVQETTNNELQSVNEELQSSNEELQTTNEEMETSNEELLSSNEELQTVNDELQAKTNEVEALNSNLTNLQNSLPHPLIMVDNERRILLHNPACKAILKYTGTLQGKPLKALKPRVDLPDLAAIIDEVRRNGTEVNRQVTGQQSYWMTCTPCFDRNDAQVGAVIIFWNNTELLESYRRRDESVSHANVQGRALEAAQQGVVIADATTPAMPILYVNQAFSDITGYSKAEVFGRNCRFLQGEGTSKKTVAALGAALRKGEAFNGQLLNYRKNGTGFYNNLSISPIYEGNKLTHFVALQADITDILAARQDDAFARSVFEHTRESVLVLDKQGRIRYANPAAAAMFGISSPRDNQGREADMVDFHSLAISGDFSGAWDTVRSEGAWQGEIETQSNGDPLTLLVSINRVASEELNDDEYALQATNITLLKHREEQLTRLATIDQLTGLPNRGLFNTRLKETISRSERSGARFALLFMDVDNFKRINDTLGHKQGDEVLQHFTRTVQNMIRDIDTFARISGDEFVVILDGVDDVSGARHFSQRIIDAIARPYRVDGDNLLLSVSIGVAIYPTDGDHPESLITNADMAMYRAKQRGKGQVAFAEADRSNELWQQIQIESELRKGLIDGKDIGLYLVYQPMYDALNQDRLYGFEALIRWDHPTLGTLQPDDFLPLARSAGFGRQLDTWVFTAFLKQYARWVREFKQTETLQYAINIDPSSSDLLNHTEISAMLADLDDDLNRPRLTLEITENALLHRSDELVTGLQSLHDMGTTIAIDDFGNGYSNFGYITDFSSIRQIKLDRSMIQGIDNNPGKLKRMRAIIRMLEEVGYKTVIEGVETDKQLTLLNDAGHNVVQGFYLSRPLKADDARQLIDDTGQGVSGKPS